MTSERLASMMRTLRARLKWTQEDLAERSGLSVGTIAGIESGRVLRPRRATLRMLADALGLSERQRAALARAARGVPAGSDAADNKTTESTAANDSSRAAGPPTPLQRLVVPGQLPSAIAGFVGRVDVLRCLDDLAAAGGQPKAVVISAVSGTAGVGKTTLAVHWAHHIRDRFPDGQLYVNLRGFDPSGSVMEPAEAMRGFLDALGVAPQRIPVDLHAQAALYRSLLNGKRVLVVLDNVRDTNQVRPLLPGCPSCLVVVTSRNALTGLVAKEAAHLLILDLLTTAEAHQMLVRRLGHDRVAAEPDATAEIIEHCARLPLALAIVAARVAAHPQFSLRTLADELRGDRLDAFADDDQDADVRVVFSWSYNQLTPQAQWLFRLLGLHPGPDISTPAAASLAGTPVQQVKPLLAELTRAHLVSEHLPGRYSFHDLLRAYAAELAHAHHDHTQRRTTTRRLLDHYLHTAHAADGLLNPVPGDPPALTPAQDGVTPERLEDYGQAMAWFASEHLVLLAGLNHAATAGFDTHTWQLAWTLATFLYRRGHRHDVAVAWRTALEATKRLGDRPAQARAHRYLARAYMRLGRYDDAHTHLQHALDLHSELGDPTDQARTHVVLGLLFARYGRYADALDCARQALDLYQTTAHHRGQADTLNAIGWYHVHLGNHEHALTCCAQALALHQELGNRNGQADTWDSLGYAHHHLRQFDEAVECYQHSLDLSRELGDLYDEAQTLTHLGDTHHTTGNTTAARRSWQQALAILDDLDHPEADALRAKLKDLEQPSAKTHT